MSVSSRTLRQLITTKHIIVLLGSGGVGKTTSSIAIAFAAAQAGRRVALLSIDPAKRLAAALGLSLGNELKKVELPQGDMAAAKGGCVDAAMLDQKAVFDAMVHRHAPSASAAARILAHPLYRAASSNLSGPLEYMALAKLQELAENPAYDLVVLDTPPDTHALDFIERPNVLAGFMEHKVMSWLIKPFVLANKLGLGKLFSLGERLMGGVAKITGVKALHTFGEFLVLIQEVIEGFHRSGERVVDLLHRADAGFFLVTVPTHASARSAANLSAELVRLGYRSDVVLFNRSLPSELAQAMEAQPLGELANEAHCSASQVHSSLQALYLRHRGERHVVGQLQSQLLAQQGGRPEEVLPTVVRISEQESDLSSLDALWVLSHEMGDALL